MAAQDYFWNPRPASGQAVSAAPARGTRRPQVTSTGTAIRPGSASRQPSVRLFFVDDGLTLTLLSRLLADERAADLLNGELATTPIHKLLEQRHNIPGDLNSALVARCLLELPDRSVAFPLLPTGKCRLGQPARVKGRIISLVRRDDELVLRVDNEQVGTQARLGLPGCMQRGWLLTDLRGCQVIAGGFIRRPRSNDLVIGFAALLDG